MEDECIIGSFTGSKSPYFAETVVVVELLGSTPLCRERRIGNNRIKLSVAKGISFERIAILYAEIAELDAVQQHVHTGKIVGCGVFLLPKDFVSMADVCSAKQK